MHKADINNGNAYVSDIRVEYKVESEMHIIACIVLLNSIRCMKHNAMYLMKYLY